MERERLQVFPRYLCNYIVCDRIVQLKYYIFISISLLLIGFAGCKKNDGIVNTVSGEYTEDFETLWNHFDKEYCYFPFKNIDWQNLYNQYRPAVDTVSSMESFVSICVSMLSPLRDGHIYFLSPEGKYIPTHINIYPKNYDAGVYQALYQNYNGIMINNSTGFAVIDSILCIGINSWANGQFNTADFDNILETNKAMLGIIIDVRANGGGNQGLALDVAGRFTSQQIAGSYYQTRNGPAHTDLTSLSTIWVRPRSWIWTKPVAVLTGRKCFSSNEGFISAMENIPGIITVGDTTGGGSGNPKFYSFSNGWQYTVPQWIEYTAKHKIIEWNGIAPDIYVKADSSDFASGADPVFNYALDWINNINR
jgi:hypothetical protein